MIQGMVDRKNEEAAAENTQQAYCQEENQKTNEKMDELSSAKEGLSAKIDKKQSQATTMKSEAAALQSELTDLVESQAGMDETRQEEKAISQMDDAAGRPAHGPEGAGRVLLRQFERVLAAAEPGLGGGP
mmetsp:Transcript_86598/g.155972  ORF Transcript_86598/g.155972 Transcript_86598/m.155972 type:complete len:130 (-) Transcript_86598:208-597(-)